MEIPMLLPLKNKKNHLTSFWLCEGQCYRIWDFPEGRLSRCS